MPDTPELRAADTRLEDAIRGVLNARGLAMPNGVLGDYMVIAVQARFDDDGDTCTAVEAVFPTGPGRYRLLGMLEEIKYRLVYDAGSDA